MGECQQEKRFEFGRNWRRYLSEINEGRIRTAEESLRALIEINDLTDLRFLDIGSGSGLFSLAARRLGANVVSFDYDPESVGCTQELKNRFQPGDSKWQIQQGSILDGTFTRTLGQFDIVYSWGVLHHTGAMYDALNNACQAVRPQGYLVIAIYNDQGRASNTWYRVKSFYNRLPSPFRFPLLLGAILRLWGPTVCRDMLTGKGFSTWRRYSEDRGMSPWYDVVDWVGGFPFEVAKPEKIFGFFREKGFTLQKLKTCAGGHGCNEFVFLRENRDLL